MSTDKNSAVAAGRMLAEAWNAGTTIDALPENLFPAEIDQATAIQEEMARVIGEPVVGWKVGGVPGPLVGRIFKSRFYTTPAKLPVRQFRSPGIECEIGFRLTKDLPPKAGSYDDETVMNAAVLAFTIELTGSRFTNGKLTADNDRDLRGIVADNAVGAGLIVGPEVADWRHLSLLDIAVDFRVNGGAPGAPNPKEKRTEPAKILIWLANELSRRGVGLRAGQYVTTGSATLPVILQKGQQAVATYGQFGSISFSLPG